MVPLRVMVSKGCRQSSVTVSSTVCRTSSCCDSSSLNRSTSGSVGIWWAIAKGEGCLCLCVCVSVWVGGYEH